MDKLLRIARGCYAPLDADLTQRCAVALTASGPGSVVAGFAAAAMHGLWLPTTVSAPELARTTAEHPSALISPMRRPGILVHRWQVPQHHIAIVDTLPITSIERTWWDLASRLSLPDLVAAGDRALQLGASRPALAAMVRTKARRRGNATARAALPLLDARSGSRPESHLRVIARLHGLDCFEVNVPILDAAGGWLATPDLSCGRTRIALEYQGKEHAELTRMRRDITRDTDLRHADWRVLYYGPVQVFSRPDQIGPELAALHASRQPRHHE